MANELHAGQRFHLKDALWDFANNRELAPAGTQGTIQEVESETECFVTIDGLEDTFLADVDWIVLEK